MVMQRASLGEYDMEVELTLFTPEEGGWISGLSQFQASPDGPRLYVGRCEYLAAFMLKDCEYLYPGETTHAFVIVSSPHQLIGKLFPGQQFLLRASQRPIGRGRVLLLLNLEKHAEETLKEKKGTNKNIQLSYEKRISIPPSWEKPRYRPRKKKRDTF